MQGGDDGFGAGRDGGYARLEGEDVRAGLVGGAVGV